MDLVQHFRDAIASGEYVVNPDAVAAAMLCAAEHLRANHCAHRQALRSSQQVERGERDGSV